jgi:PEP-CTERM motif
MRMSQRAKVAVLTVMATVLSLLPAGARANQITLFDVPGFAPLTLTLVATNGTPVILLAADVRGLNGAAITDPSLVGLELVGNIDPSTPFPNAQLYAINVDPGTYAPLGDSISIALDFGTLSVFGTVASVWGVGTPLSGPIGDPGLSTLLGTLRFDFDLISLGPDPSNPNQSLSQWQLGAVEAIPEPTSMLLLGSGLAGVRLMRRRRRAI